MDSIFNIDENKADEMTLDSKISTIYPPNATDTDKNDPKINRDVKIEATEKLLEE